MTPPESLTARGARGGTSGNPARREVEQQPIATWRDWVGGARVRTLAMAVAPVLVGTAAAIRASDPGEYYFLIAGLCLVISVSLQIGVNFANDYSDGVRGTDDNRVGPGRLVGGGLAPARRVLIVALVFFALAAVAGLAVTILSGVWWLLAVGAVAIIAAWFYTGGRKPYGYLGLGELFVFVFFGPVATLGTMFVQVGIVSDEAIIGAISVGLIACAALEVNNIRDIEQDRASGKKTLSVRIGAKASIVLFCVLLLVPFLLVGWLALFYPALWLTFFGLLIALPACLITATAKTAPELILVLKLVGVLQLVFSAVFAVALIF